MAVEAETCSERRRLTFLDIVIIVFFGLTGVGLVCLGGFGWLIATGLAHTHGGDARGAVNIIFPGIAFGGAALIVSAFRRTFRKDGREQH